MKKILIISNNALGDCVPSIIAIAKNLVKNSKIFCIVSTNNQYNFLREIPIFYSVIQSNNNFPYLKIFFENPQKFFNLHLEKFLDLSKQFCLFDEVYITRLPQYKIFKENIDPSFLKNVVAPLESNQKRPADRIKRNIDLFGFSDTDISVDINFYKKYYFDFKCTKRTVLFNPISEDQKRCYKRGNEVVKILTDLGFDVRQFDFNYDVRKNFHLIHQAPFILTTDTSTLWLAKTLNKKPYVFVSNDICSNNEIEEQLGLKNIIQNKGNIDLVQPQEIVDGFLKSINDQSVWHAKTSNPIRFL